MFLKDQTCFETMYRQSGRCRTLSGTLSRSYMLPELAMAGKARGMARKAWAMVGKFPDCLYFVPNHVYSLRYVLQLPDCLYLLPNHVYSFSNVLHLPDCLYLVPDHVYSFRNILHHPDCLYLVPNHVYSFRYVLHLPVCLYLVPGVNFQSGPPLKLRGGPA